MGDVYQIGGEIDILGPLVSVELNPGVSAVPTGSTAPFTLTVTNLENTERTYDLSSQGIALVNQPNQISVAANSTATIPISVQPVGEGRNPFTVIASEENSGTSANDTSSVIGEGFSQVLLAVTPVSVPSGAGVITPLTVRITNLSSQPETFEFSTNLPSGWGDALTLLGQGVSTMQVAPGVGNGVELQWLIIPDSTAAPGDYAIEIRAASAENPMANATDQAEVQIGDLGVVVAITSGPDNISPSGSTSWQLQISNTGLLEDTYDLSVFGPLSLFAQISQDTITIPAGSSQSVAITVNNYDLSLSGEIVLGLLAKSQTQTSIQAQDEKHIMIELVAGVAVSWLPNEITIDGITNAAFSLVITNTGNVLTTYAVTVNSDPRLEIGLPTDSLLLPPASIATLLLPVNAPGSGNYSLTATVESGIVQDSANSLLIVEGVDPPITEFYIYLPLVSP